MTAIEAIAFVLGVANVLLLVRRSIWNYPFGIVMVLLYAVIFHDAKLYSDALLQLFFLVVQIYGWLHWRRASLELGEIRVERLSGRARALIAAASAAAIIGWGGLMYSQTDASFPFWDAAVAILSVAAQILLARRYVENWLLWILVDLLSIGLYAAKGLWLTMALYIIFLGLASWGLVQWRRAMAAGATAGAKA
jgi:nicotinamide mononucleotide transporter